MEQRERGLDRRTHLSLLYPVLAGVERYLDFSGDWESLVTALEEVHAELVTVLQALEQLGQGLDLAELGEEILDHLESLPLEEPGEESELRLFFSSLESLEERWIEHDLGKLQAYLQSARERDQLLARLQEPGREKEEEGRYQTVLGWWQAVAEQRLESAIAFQRCQTLLEEMKAGLRAYETTPLSPEEWTAEVALSDELLQEAFQLWLQGLTSLAQSCLAVDGEQASEALTLIRQGNRCFLLAEQLSQVP